MFLFLLKTEKFILYQLYKMRYWIASSDDKAEIKEMITFNDQVGSLVLQIIKISESGTNPKHTIQDFDKFFIDNIDKSDTVLDIGCGYGHLANVLAGKASKIKGIDIRPDAIEWSKNKFQVENLEYECFDFFNYNTTDLFDVVILSNILEHIDNRKEFLQKAAQIGKKVLIRVPAYNRNWMVAYKKRFGLEWRLHKGHYLEYTEDILHDEIVNSGLNVVKLSTSWGNICGIAEKK
jgi:SAM-dependent methyltransferase